MGVGALVDSSFYEQEVYSEVHDGCAALGMFSFKLARGAVFGALVGVAAIGLVGLVRLSPGGVTNAGACTGGDSFGI